MLFHSPAFLFIFLPLFLIAAATLPTGTPRAFCLLLFAYVFYSGGEPRFLTLLIASTILDFFVALRLAKSEHPVRRKLWLAASVTGNLGMLAFFKYGAFLVQNVEPVVTFLGFTPVDQDFYKTFVLPAGISFYTFQTLSYTIDVYRREIVPEKNLVHFCNFVAYLPHLIAGPIQRYSQLAPQINRFIQGDTKRQWSAGLDRLALGLIQKLLIADSCGLIVDRLVDGKAANSFLTAWAVAVGFGLQIYYDFAGYAHMAIGISLLLGVRLSENFLSPYKAANIQEFWRRWHVSLSTWLRDYLYFSLGGSHGSDARTVANVLFTFLLCGLWHGAGWNFVAWGLAHGILVAGYQQYKNTRFAIPLPNPVAIFVTFASVSFTWILFRVSDFGAVVGIWKAMVGLAPFGRDLISVVDLAFLALVTLGTLWLPNAYQRWPGRSGPAESLALWLFATLAVLNAPQVNRFIYFQF